jgi:hypothetical protein
MSGFIDPIEAFVAYCLSDFTFNAVVDGRVCGSPPGLSGIGPSAFAPSGIPYASLVVSQGGGTVERAYPVMSPILYLRAYGQTANEAVQVLQALSPLLYHTTGELKGRLRENITIANRWLMYKAEFGALPAPVVEQQSNWPVAYTTLQTKFDSLRGA